MENIDLTILKKEPCLTEKAIVEIEAYAPLSMVSDLPGSFYKTLNSPNKKMLCGLFENVLGWHFSFNDRTKIQKDLIKLRKKQKSEFIKPQKGSTYIPLIMEYFDIKLVTIPPMLHYNDLWSRAFRRADADVHPKGTANIDYRIIPQKRELKRDTKNPKQIDNKELFNLFKENTGNFPLYYSTPTAREYVNWHDIVKIQINCDQQLKKMLLKSNDNNNVLYLGNSEGWINLKII